MFLSFAIETIISLTFDAQSFFALAASPNLNFGSTPEAVIWLWIHLLQFNVSNQTMDPEEDELNKRDRPLPSGRISLKNARVLRWALVPLCFAVSILYSLEVLYASIAMVVSTIAYNELGGHNQWLVRNLLNGFGVASFEAGTTLVTCMFVMSPKHLSEPC